MLLTSSSPLCFQSVKRDHILACLVLQVMALLRTAGGAPIQSWAPDQDELTETLWAEMGLQPDAHITLVTYHISDCLIYI